MSGLIVGCVLMFVAGVVPGWPGWMLVGGALISSVGGIFREYVDYKHRRGGWR